MRQMVCSILPLSILLVSFPRCSQCNTLWLFPVFDLDCPHKITVLSPQFFFCFFSPHIPHTVLVLIKVTKTWALLCATLKKSSSLFFAYLFFFGNAAFITVGKKRLRCWRNLRRTLWKPPCSQCFFLGLGFNSHTQLITIAGRVEDQHHRRGLAIALSMNISRGWWRLSLKLKFLLRVEERLSLFPCTEHLLPLDDFLLSYELI